MKRVVIIDDHPIIRGTIAELLRADPELDVCGECSDGESGLATVLDTNPDLVLVDLDLPRIDGLSLIRRIRMTDRVIRLLVLSAKPERSSAAHARAAGANGYVCKNREIGELLIAVKTVLFGYECFPADSTVRDTTGGINRLSPREVEVLRRLSRGMSNRAIAAQLEVSEKTVSTYKSRLQEKLGLTSLAGLIEFASFHQLID